jgi:hypothetical protein
MAIPVFKNSDQYSTLNVNKSDIRIETVTRITKILQSTVQDTRHVHSLMNPVPTLEEKYIVLINNTTKRRQKMYDHPYKYLKTPLGTCQLDGARSDPFMLIIIKSNVKNLDHRMAIRQTWANISDSSVKVIFTLGYSPFLQEYINKESSMFHDILQENFIDDYNNNTLKTVMAFNWCVTKCSKTKYFFFVDEDYLVNVRLLLTDLRKKPLDTSIYTGNVWYGAKPNRNKRSKWFISKAEYPDDVWPPYVTGGSALISFDYANRIVEGFKTTKPLFIDDVYLGIVAKKQNITLTNDARFHPYYTLTIIHKSYSIHNFHSPRKLETDWDNLIRKKINISV